MWATSGIATNESFASGSNRNTDGCSEQRLAAYELSDDGRPVQRIGYLPKDAPRREGSYLATLHRLEGKRRIEGKLSPLKECEGRKDAVGHLDRWWESC